MATIDSGLCDDREWELLLGYVWIIEKFHDASIYLKGENYQAVCVVIPLIDEILTNLEQRENVFKGDLINQTGFRMILIG